MDLHSCLRHALQLPPLLHSEIHQPDLATLALAEHGRVWDLMTPRSAAPRVHNFSNYGSMLLAHTFIALLFCEYGLLSAVSGCKILCHHLGRNVIRYTVQKCCQGSSNTASIREGAAECTK